MLKYCSTYRRVQVALFSSLFFTEVYKSMLETCLFLKLVACLKKVAQQLHALFWVVVLNDCSWIVNSHRKCKPCLLVGVGHSHYKWICFSHPFQLPGILLLVLVMKLVLGFQVLLTGWTLWLLKQMGNHSLHLALCYQWGAVPSSPHTW